MKKELQVLEINYDISKLNLYIIPLCGFCLLIMGIFWYWHLAQQAIGGMVWFVTVIMVIFQMTFIICRLYVRSKIVFEADRVTVYRPIGNQVYNPAQIVKAEYGLKYVEGGKFTTISRFLELGFADGKKLSILDSSECPLDKLIPFVRRLYCLNEILQEVNRCDK